MIRNFTGLTDVLTLTEDVIFNCTGLGAAALFTDAELVPAKGQLVFLPPDPAVDYMTIGGGRGLLYMFPRSDVVLLGGTFVLNDYTMQPDPDETERSRVRFAPIGQADPSSLRESRGAPARPVSGDGGRSLRLFATA